MVTYYVDVKEWLRGAIVTAHGTAVMEFVKRLDICLENCLTLCSLCTAFIKAFTAELLSYHYQTNRCTLQIWFQKTTVRLPTELQPIIARHESENWSIFLY